MFIQEREKVFCEEFEHIGLKILEVYNFDWEAAEHFDVLFELNTEKFLQNIRTQLTQHQMEQICLFQRFSVETTTGNTNGNEFLEVDIEVGGENVPGMDAFLVDYQMDLLSAPYSLEMKKMLKEYGYGEAIKQIEFLEVFSREEAIKKYHSTLFKLKEEMNKIKRMLEEIILEEAQKGHEETKKKRGGNSEKGTVGKRINGKI